MIRLPEANRAEIRDFMSDCAVKRAEIALKLDQFYRLDAQAKQLQAAGQGPQAQHIQQQALVPLGEAHKAADRLVAVASKASAIRERLRAAR
jgi:lipase chaperone LimK